MDRNVILDNSESAAKLLLALANRKRIEIISHLYDGACPVGVLAQKVDLSQSALSQHLAKLRSQGLVTTRRDGQTIYYSMKDGRVGRLLQCLQEIYYPD